MKPESVAESPANATLGSSSVHRLEDAALLDQMLMSCLADAGISMHVSSPMGQCLMRRARPNVLLVGALTDIEAALSTLLSDAPIVVHDWICDAPMPERDRPDVVIIRDVDRVPLTLQDAWLSWLTDRRDRPQIIATSRAPVFPLVVGGAFRSDLYYRLNTLLLDLRTGPSTPETTTAQRPVRTTSECGAKLAAPAFLSPALKTFSDPEVAT